MNIMNRFTIKTLKQNRVRTIVTIIGIILSTAMFTGVTSIIASLQQYIVDLEIELDGAWEARLSGLSEEQVKKLRKDDRIKDTSVIKNVGYVSLENCLNEDKPYLCIQSLQKNFTDMSPIILAEGRMPENDSEILLSKHLEDNGGISYQIGDTLSLEVGQRWIGEMFVGGQDVSYSGEEQLKNKIQKQYQVVGICERPVFETYSAPGYTAFTMGIRAENNTSYDVLFQAKDARKIGEITDGYMEEWLDDDGKQVLGSEIHDDLLRFQGTSTEGSYVSVLLGMGSILILIIMIASISLIYNAFSISVGERTKQFGLLKSIGATKRQIRKSVLFEVFSLCVVGIPLGIGGGLLGIGIALHFVGELLYDMMTNGESTHQLELYVSVPAILVAVIVAIITVLISAMIPARRAVKIPAIQALRQSNEIRLGRRNIKSSRLVYKVFGFEGMLANKNFKRNKRKHRMTVFSLTISVILFLATSSFSNYMMKSISFFEEISEADITFSATQKELAGNSLEKAKKVVGEVKAVDTVAYSTILLGIAQVDEENLSKEYLDLLKENLPDHYDKKTGKVVVDTYVTYVEDDIYRKYLEKNNMDVSRFMDTNKLYPLIWDTVNLYGKDSSLVTVSMLSKDKFVGDLYFFKAEKLDSYTYCGEVANASDMTLVYEEAKGDSTQTKNISCEEGLSKLTLSDSQVMEENLPLGVSDTRWGNGLNFVLPYSASEKLPKDVTLTGTSDFYILSKNHKVAAEELSEYFQNNNSGYSSAIASHIYDIRATADSNRAVVWIVNIFSYGFIILITLIVVANVFNTVSTNIQLRRKEFAMLKSVGLTQKGFDRMMNYECLLYGVKGLVFGLPVSFVLCYLMYKSLQPAWNVTFMIPWLSVGIVIISVFVIVFTSMLYSMKKIKKENPIDALRDDNM